MYAGFYTRYVRFFYRLGAHYRTNGTVGTEQDIDVAEIIMHENYFSPLAESNDIALLKLLSPADLGDGVELVCLPDTNHELPIDNLEKKCWVTGWGSLYFSGPSPNTLMQGSVPLVSKERCDNAYPDAIDDSMLCAGLDEGGIDACQGDSGGPLVCEFSGTWYLEGVTSWGEGCAYPNKYGVYAKVRNFLSWISRNMNAPPTESAQNQSSALGKYDNCIIIVIYSVQLLMKCDKANNTKTKYLYLYLLVTLHIRKSSLFEI